MSANVLTNMKGTWTAKELGEKIDSQETETEKSGKIV